MADREECELCDRRFDAQRDTRRWAVFASPITRPGLEEKNNAARLIVCSPCFLDAAEAEHGVD